MVDESGKISAVAQNSAGKAIKIIAPTNGEIYPKKVTIDCDETMIATPQGLSGNYKANEEKGVMMIGTNNFGLAVDGTTINVVNDKLSNNAQFNFDGDESKGVALVNGKV